MTESLGKAIERLQKAAHGWKGFQHAAVKQADLQLVLNELYRLRVQNLACVLEDHEGLKAQLGKNPPENWTVTYSHLDCAECENCAEQAISYAKAANSPSEQLIKSAFGGHSGSAKRV